MMWDLPTSVNINGKIHSIRNMCDYRVVLDVICALKDDELTEEEKIQCALFIFYEDFAQIEDYEIATKEMFRIINNGNDEDQSNGSETRLMDWEHDYSLLTPPISRILGYDVRTPNKYTHWYSFLGGYMEIGDCTFATVVSIRSKRAKGKKLEKWEIDFLREHRKMVDLPKRLTNEEQEILNSAW